MHPTPAGMYPSLLPPGMDPAHVDLRTFYPYQPNEVKHRKRTTSAQLKVLEGIFKTDTKPNAALRTRLAAQLDMTPRGVQVWFQNRRAKEKLKASKAAAAAAAASRKGRNANEGSKSEDRKEDIDDDEESTTPPAVQFDTPSPTVESPVTQLPVPPTNSPGIRRPSLPTSNGHEMVPPNFDPHTRRASVDPNLLRYATNPYARPNHLLSRVPGRPGPYPMRPNAMHRPSMPILPSAGLQGFTAQPGQAPLYSPRGSLPDNSLYMSHARPLEPSPIPAGPLPQPGFSFGAASSTLSPESAGSSERNSPDSLQQYSFPGQPRTALPEFDEDDDSSLYGGQSTRFGSITSVASRDSFYSDLSDMHPAGFMADHRRGSSTSGFPTTMMSALDMNGASEGADGRRFSLPGSDIYPSPQSTGQLTMSPTVPGTDFQPPQQQQSYELTYPPQQQSVSERDQQQQHQYATIDTFNTGGSSSPPLGTPSDTTASYYYPTSSIGTPESQFNTPDPGAAVPNTMTTVPYLDLPDFSSPAHMQVKYDLGGQDGANMVPPTIVQPPSSVNGCYDPVSFNQETAMLYNNGQPRQPLGQPVASFAW